MPLDFEALFNVSPNAYLLLAPDLTIAAANDALLQVTGREREELTGQPFFRAFPGDSDDPSRRRLKSSFQKVLSTGEPDSLALIRYPILKPESGEEREYVERYWSTTHRPVFDEQGEVEYILQHAADVTEFYEEGYKEGPSLKDRSSSLSLDQDRDRPEPPDREEPSTEREEGTVTACQRRKGLVTRAKEVQKSYWATEAERARLRQLFEQAPGFMTFMRGPDHVFEMVNEAYLEVIGHREVVGKPVREALPEVEGQGYFDLLDQVYETGEPFVGREREVRLKRGPDDDLESVYVDFIYQPIFKPDGSVSGIFVQGHDVTEKKQVKDRLRRQKAELQKLNDTLEERVKERTRQVRTLTTQVTKAQQRERRRIAHRLHDDLQQKLYGSRLQISSLWTELKNAEKEALAKEAEQLEVQIEAVIQSMRQLSVGMSPPVLEREGLTAVLEWLQSHMGETYGLDVELTIEQEFHPKEEVQVLLFQTARELLIKAAEHEGVEGTPVTLGEEDGDLVLHVTVEDETFHPEHVEGLGPEEGMGLAAVQKRLRLFGGELLARSPSGGETQVVVRLPLTERSELSLLSNDPEDLPDAEASHDP
jgi:PAS domain S-box-containing protein